MSEEEDDLINLQEQSKKLDLTKFPPNDFDRIKVEGLTEEEAAWYNWLDEGDLKQLEDSYFGKVHNRRGKIGLLTYASYVKVCAAVAVRMHKKQGRKEKKNMDRLARYAREQKGHPK
jgi:hypothetical protein